MKFLKNKFTRLGTLLAIASSLTLATFHAPAQIAGQTQGPNYWIADTNAFPLTLTNAQGVSFPADGTNSLDRTIRQDHGQSMFATVVSTNASATSVTLSFDVTEDGTLYTGPLVHQFTWVLPANFVGTNSFWTNIPTASLNNVRQQQLTGATNNSTYTVKIPLFEYSQSLAFP